MVTNIITPDEHEGNYDVMNGMRVWRCSVTNKVFAAHYLHYISMHLQRVRASAAIKDKHKELMDGDFEYEKNHHDIKIIAQQIKRLKAEATKLALRNKQIMATH